MPIGVNMRQTTHAVERWRQRVAPNEGPTDIALAFARAALVAKSEQLPFPRTPHTTYYRHAVLPDIYFVTQDCNQHPGDTVLVTVVDASKLWGVAREFVAAPPQSQAGMPPPWSEPEHEHAGARQAWLLAEWERTRIEQNKRLALHKRHPERKAWGHRIRMIEHQLHLHKRDLMTWQVEQQAKEAA